MSIASLWRLGNTDTRSNYSPCWSKAVYLAPLAGLLLEPRGPTILFNHSPTRPRELRLSDRTCGWSLPSTILTAGGSMSSGGIAASDPNGLPRRSREGTGDPARKRDPVSDWMPGVPMAVLASPNSESISSNLTPQVSGYMKYTIAR